MVQKLLKLFFVICILGFSNIQAQTVSGTITDAADGTPLPGVNVIIKGTNTGVSSDFDGKYIIDITTDNAVLQFSFLGYTTQEIAVGGQTTINVSLAQSAEALSEVVVTALGIKKERQALGYSITEVKGEEISLVKETNAINALQGKVAGVSITGNSTGSAGSTRVIIRGNTSLTGNNQPLYVIDGIPMGNDQNGAAGMWGGNDGGDGISSLNADEIASVSVLKGGPAAALYGSRASNGVILITTKTGQGQKGLGVEFSSSATADVVNTDLTDYQTEYGQGTNGTKPLTQQSAFENATSSWGARLDGTSVVQWDGVSRPYSYVGNNLDKFYRTGSTFINTLAISGGNETSNFRFSASDLSNDDIMPNASLNRKSFSLNVGAVLAEKLTLSTNVKYIREYAMNRPRLSDAPGNGNYTVSVLPANVDVTTMDPGTNEDGTERQYADNIYSQNPYFAAYNFRNEDQKNRVIASTSLRYDIFDWLYVTGRAGIDDYTRRSTGVTPWGTAFQPNGSMNEQERRYTQIDSDFLIGVDKDITDKFATTSFIGAAANSIERETLTLSGGQFIVPGLETVKNTKNQSTGYGYGKEKINSIYGSVEVSYDKLAYLTFTARNDWFSTLSAPGKTSPNDDLYTSVNTSIILSKILEMPEWVDFAKFRAGYSELAGGAPNPYSLSLSYEIFGQGHLGQPLGQISGGTIPNENLIPYNLDELEFGLDAQLFNGKLSVDLSYYDKNTTNDIVAVAASQTSGFGSATANLGEISNKGFEAMISASPVKTENFEWGTTVTYANNKSEIIGTNDTGSDIVLGEARSRNVFVRHIIGQPYGMIYGVSYERDANGTIIYQIGDDGIPRAKEGARKILGEGVAPTQVGWNNNLNYKNWNLNFHIDAKFGGQISSNTNAGAAARGQHKMTLEGRENGLSVSGIDDATGQAFTTTVAPQDLDTYYGELWDIAEEWVEDADYIKFRQLSIGYNFPSTMLDKTFLTSASISFIGKNLFFIHRSIDNIDPESAYDVGNAQGLEYYGVPATRSYGLSLNVKF